jgi:hypothetical protein
MSESRELAGFILAELVESMGGIVELDANRLLKTIKSGEYKEISLSIKDGKAIVEVIDER